MRLLFISYHFPPSRAARSLQVGKLTKYLLRRNFHIDVITCAVECIPARDVDGDAASLTEHDRIRVFRVSSPPRSNLDWIHAATRGQNFPGWCRGAALKAVELVKAGEGYDAVVSFAMPIDSHFAARRVKKAAPYLKWVAHFSDPWANNPYIGGMAGIRKRIYAALEMRICREADMVLAVSEELTADFARRHRGADGKFETLHHVFDPAQYPADEKERHGPVVLRYLGGFSSLRRPDTLIAALRSAAQTGADLSALRIDFVGGGMEPVVRELNELHAGLATAGGAVRYQESLALMQDADALLLIDADLKWSPYFPSKLVDYFGARRPIIAITPGHSCSDRLIREAGGLCFGHDEIDRLGSLFLELSRRGRNSLIPPDTSQIQCYAAERGAERFELLMRRLVPAIAGART